MEQSTKTILWIVAFVTLPISIPLAIISAGMILTVIAFAISILAVSMPTLTPIDGMLITVIAAFCYWIYYHD